MAASDRDVLPDTIKPTNYNLSLFELEFGGSWSYNGVVKIDTKVLKTVREITLNSKELEIGRAIIQRKDANTSITASNISYSLKSERATLAFAEDISPADCILTIDFRGTMNNAMMGFYRSKYKPTVKPAAGTASDDEHHYMFSTQFESSDARRAFPCFDEPNLKATFEFQIEVPQDQVALSNMNEKAVKEAKKPGFKVVSFERTPPMSTYLAAWAVGDFEYVEAYTKRKYNGVNVPCRVYTTRGLKDQGRFALENAPKIIDLFSEKFQIDYPFPKADILAVHEFAMGAMENWGLVTYRTTAVLFDEATSDARFKNRIAYVVAHELAHQWFGNLVTMDWWSELWLNEGFATWVGWYAIGKFGVNSSYVKCPEVAARFLNMLFTLQQAEGLQTAFQLDSLRASHPIEVPVRDALEVDQIFDAISYLKGSSVIRMLSSHIGVDVFLSGVAEYLKKHAYGNATTYDLWSALSEASGQDVTKFMDPWIRNIGFPVVTVAEEPGQIGIGQRRFLTTGDVKPEEDQTTWWIPLGLKSGTEAATVGSALTSKQETIRDVDDSFYKLNADANGFYRTNYPPQRLAKLGQSRDRLSVEDKIGIIGDAGALAVAGDGTTAGLLAFVEGFRDEKNYQVWSQLSSSLATCRSVFAENDQISEGLRRFTLRLVSTAAEQIGWEYKKGEDYLTGQLRKLLLGMACGAGHEGIISEAQRLFSRWMEGDQKAVNPSLRSVIFNINIAEGSKAQYDAVMNEYLTTGSIDGKEICLQALGRTRQPELTRQYLEFALSDKVPIQDAHNAPSSVAANGKTRRILWQYLKENWTAVHNKLSANNIVLDRWIKLGLAKYADHALEQDIATFFKDKDNRGYDRSLVIVSDTIKGSANYRERDEGLVLEWLKAHDYA